MGYPWISHFWTNPARLGALILPGTSTAFAGATGGRRKPRPSRWVSVKVLGPRSWPISIYFYGVSAATFHPLFGSPHFGVFQRRNGSVTGCKEYGGLNRKLKVSVRFVKAIKPCKPILKLMKLSFGKGMVSSMVMPRRVSCFFGC